ncbi:hypothetical protein JST56_07525 [Candidatus Dependentiae bacterium]|jgi:hypothetical protein|nr:hypothetical protein [Candidatus Dependentiae bacterium]
MIMLYGLLFVYVFFLPMTVAASIDEYVIPDCSFRELLSQVYTIEKDEQLFDIDYVFKNRSWGRVITDFFDPAHDFSKKIIKQIIAGKNLIHENSRLVTEFKKKCLQKNEYYLYEKEICLGSDDFNNRKKIIQTFLEIANFFGVTKENVSDNIQSISLDTLVSFNKHKVTFTVLSRQPINSSDVSLLRTLSDEAISGITLGILFILYHTDAYYPLY